MVFTEVGIELCEQDTLKPEHRSETKRRSRMGKEWDSQHGNETAEEPWREKGLRISRSSQVDREHRRSKHGRGACLHAILLFEHCGPCDCAIVDCHYYQSGAVASGSELPDPFPFQGICIRRGLVPTRVRLRCLCSNKSRVSSIRGLCTCVYGERVRK